MYRVERQHERRHDRPLRKGSRMLVILGRSHTQHIYIPNCTFDYVDPVDLDPGRVVAEAHGAGGLCRVGYELFSSCSEEGIKSASEVNEHKIFFTDHWEPQGSSA